MFTGKDQTQNIICKDGIASSLVDKSIPIHNCMNLQSSPTHEYFHFGHLISAQSTKKKKKKLW